MECLHFFDIDISGMTVPERLNSPFNYEPHPLALAASRQVRRHIESEPVLDEIFSQGKMLGVLVVAAGKGECAFLAAYSGSIELPRSEAGYFVPPVFDLLDAAGYFKREEREISCINREIEAIEHGDELAAARNAVEVVTRAASSEIERYRQFMAAAKRRRDAARAERPCADTSALIRESQHQKAELRRLRKAWDDKIEAARQELAAIETRLADLKAERHRRSEALQRWIFSRFSMLNARGERRDLLEIFAGTPQRVPPAGTGECAAPRLLQYAYLNSLKPLAIAEFWYGSSHGSHVRHDGMFYTACRSKCLPILNFMLQGLDMDCIDLPYLSQAGVEDLDVIYEDKWIIAVDKPAGVPTVPGRSCGKSLLDMLQERYTMLEGPVVVHRLDMDTSGIVVFARDKETHKRLQAMFAGRLVSKQYMALLDGIPITDSGIINLPLRPDYEHRPMQVVDEAGGYEAVTRYEVVKRYPGLNRALVRFYPLTGRTHQLRVHAAHRLGLGTPIVGDRLYGRRLYGGGRLHLHAERLEFVHPHTGRPVVLHSDLPSCFADL